MVRKHGTAHMHARPDELAHVPIHPRPVVVHLAFLTSEYCGTVSSQPRLRSRPLSSRLLTFATGPKPTYICRMYG
ncbi:hypothetical protein BAUCODRAFT_31477 [Baudoinia panamericana UAMH 10762]|uniref:Uncharacterized protein n=1 Tax=Baudoinia panamericana (strain UAMH 10762) TaxID=717646 RepID=M2MQS1_BAUPA|nr:uncharacterized protein BAUCODRAFT_31477 [Baudoinia panamericana UAMH 10762]EMC99161.1 hypothetical protein BAUCODRAFT_31477 [Baudoinia panamericana UAMH 10762]